MPDAMDFELGSAPKSWACVPAMRTAMSRYPKASYIFFLDHTALIMDQNVSIHERFFANAVTLQIPDYPVVPPDSVIHTWEHRSPHSVYLIMARDSIGLAQSSMLLRCGPWATFFLDTWFDPLLRSFNFQRAEAHALVSHIIPVLDQIVE